MTAARKIRTVFKRLETDKEFGARLVAAGLGRWDILGMSGNALDEYGWRWRKMQRRLIEDFA